MRVRGGGGRRATTGGSGTLFVASYGGPVLAWFQRSMSGQVVHFVASTLLLRLVCRAAFKTAGPLVKPETLLKPHPKEITMKLTVPDLS